MTCLLNRKSSYIIREVTNAWLKLKSLMTIARVKAFLLMMTGVADKANNIISNRRGIDYIFYDAE